MAELTRDEVAVGVDARDDGAVVRVRVVPRAPRTALVGRHGRALRLKVHAPPVDGAANEEVRRFVAAACGMRAADVRLLTGERSRDKAVLVPGRTTDEVVDGLLSAR